MKNAFHVAVLGYCVGLGFISPALASDFNESIVNVTRWQFDSFDGTIMIGAGRHGGHSGHGAPGAGSTAAQTQ
jgi:hypothetical protein